MMLAPERIRRVDLIVCATTALLFGMLTLQELELPGPHTDEVFPAAPAVNFHQGRNTSDPLQIDPSVVTIAGRPLPLMLLTYVGAPQTFLYVPVFALFGDDITVVRGLPIALGMAALCVSYLFFLLLFGRPAALLATGLTLADPGFVFFVGRDFGPPALAILARMSMLLFLLLWWRNGRRWQLAAGAAAAGIGLYHKADFLWTIVALAAAGLAVFHRDLRQRVKPADISIASGSFAITAAPFLLMNTLTGGATFWLLNRGVPVAEQLLQWLAGIGVRFGQLGTLLNGTASFRLFMGSAPPLHFMQAFLLPVVIASGSVLLVVHLLRRRRAGRLRALWFLLLMTTIVLLLSGKTPTFLMEHHLLALSPLIHGLAAAGILAAAGSVRVRFRHTAPVGVAALLLVCGATGVWTVRQTYDALRVTGGRGYWSDAIYDLGAYLHAQQRPVALMEWGFTTNLIVVTGGALTTFRVYKEFMDRGVSPEAVLPRVTTETLFLFHTPAFSSFSPAFTALDLAAREKNLRVQERRRFVDREGNDVYIVYELKGP